MLSDVTKTIDQKPRVHVTSRILTDSLPLNQWLDSINGWTVLGGGVPNHDQSPQLVESPADGVVGLGRLTVQGHCLSGHSHYPPSQPLAQLLTQDKRERESAGIWLRCPNNAAICSLCPAPLLWAQWFSGKSI